MKRGKLIILFFGLFLLTGCTVEYNLTIDKNSMKEESTFIFDNTEENDKSTDNLVKSPPSAFYDMDSNESKPYEVTKKKKKDKIYVTYSYNFLEDQLRNSILIDKCYYQKNVIKDDDYITLTTSEQVSCLFEDGNQIVDELKVNIKTKLEVVENNADYYNKDTYTWVINKDNYTNKPINIKLKATDNGNKKNSISFTSVIIALGIGVVVVLIIYYIFKRKNKKANEI